MLNIAKGHLTPETALNYYDDINEEKGEIK